MSLMQAPAPSEVTLEAGGHAKGVAVAIVRQNKDDSGQGRVKVSYPWHSQPQESYWARVAMPMAGKTRGIYFIPEVQDEVLVAFERGDMRFPYVVGSLWNGQDQSPETNADGKNDIRVVRSRKGHKLTFNDGSKGLVQLELNDGKKIAIDDNGIVVDDGNGNSISIQSSGGSISIQAATKVEIKAPQISIQASGTMDLQAGPSMSLKAGVININ
ncbi:MAG TPA: phage baseplate assembly protein V [Bryobacteraceae bacterium]|nr:phage baseplate assembly protein V [Bryobacteraceae bacterium]